MQQRQAIEEILKRYEELSPDIKSGSNSSTLGKVWDWVKGYGWIVIPAVLVYYQSSKIRYDTERTILLENVAGRLGIGNDDTDDPRIGYKDDE